VAKTDVKAEAGGSPAGMDIGRALRRPEAFPHPVEDLRVIETHISWVVLTGRWAYKIKKPVNLGFLDFTTLRSRHHFCEEELRLNRRLAPELYDSVVAIGGTPELPQIGGPGPALEYAVKMREFSQEALASDMLLRGTLTPEHVDALARAIAQFHQRAARADAESTFGTPAAALGPALDNFETLQQCVKVEQCGERLRSLRDWTGREYAARHADFAARRRDGFIRECHGDLHLRNVAVLDDRPVAFDCIEFDEQLRWIDVMSEIAFVVMDFEDRGRRDFAWRFINTYLEITGDYDGVRVLNFYLVYRALVRAKVHALRACQPHIGHSERARLDSATRAYIALAARFATPARPAVIITHGLSGSGKTTATQALLGRIGAIRVRSDVERKRLHGLSALARTGSPPGAGLYEKESTLATYEHLRSLARRIVDAGYPVVVDAAFLKRAERDAFRALSAALGVPFLILAFEAPHADLRERLARRLHAGTDASEADPVVLERQIEFQEAITRCEHSSTLHIDTRSSLTPVFCDEVARRVFAD
jgi:aminoglycoside phosphotransferase family enzyme/predicted kinase